MRAVNRTRGTLVGHSIRIAETGLTRIVGLLGERELLPGDGLLILSSQGVHTWGMRFPIDIVILDDDWNVLAVRRNMRPFRIGRLYWKAAAVLELSAGAVDTSCTAVGDTIEFSRVEGRVGEGA